MKLEEQVCSLDLAKRLKELGVFQESLFGWRLKHPSPMKWVLWSSGTHEEFVGDESFSAFTVAELGEMLPNWVHMSATIKDMPGRYVVCRDRKSDGVVYYFNDDAAQYADTEADARAKMLIYLLENNLVTL